MSTGVDGWEYGGNREEGDHGEPEAAEIWASEQVDYGSGSEQGDHGEPKVPREPSDTRAFDRGDVDSLDELLAYGGGSGDEEHGEASEPPDPGNA